MLISTILTKPLKNKLRTEPNFEKIFKRSSTYP